MAHLKIHIRLLISKWSRSHAYQSQSCGLKNRQIASVWTREKRDCASGRQKKSWNSFLLVQYMGPKYLWISFLSSYKPVHIQEKCTQKAYSSCPLTLVMLKLRRYHNNFGQFKFMMCSTCFEDLLKTMSFDPIGISRARKLKMDDLKRPKILWYCHNVSIDKSHWTRWGSLQSVIFHSFNYWKFKNVYRIYRFHMKSCFLMRLQKIFGTIRSFFWLTHRNAAYHLLYPL